MICQSIFRLRVLWSVILGPDSSRRDRSTLCAQPLLGRGRSHFPLRVPQRHRRPGFRDGVDCGLENLLRRCRASREKCGTPLGEGNLPVKASRTGRDGCSGEEVLKGRSQGRIISQDMNPRACSETNRSPSHVVLVRVRNGSTEAGMQGSTRASSRMGT